MDESPAMTAPFLARASSLLCAVLLASCASNGPGQALMPERQGSIEQITPAELRSSHHAGVGAVVGGVVGLGMGNLIGSGTSRDVAEVLGAVGGPVMGNETQRKYEPPVPAQRIIVRISNGVLVSVTQPETLPLSVGQRVYIEGHGEAARVIPR